MSFKSFLISSLIRNFNLCCFRAPCECVWRGEPAWWSICEWSPPPQPHQSEDSGAGTAGDQALRHQQTAQVGGHGQDYTTASLTFIQATLALSLKIEIINLSISLQS